MKLTAAFKKGEAPKNLRIYTLAERRLIDTELTRRAIDFMDRPTKAKTPFLAQPHMPTIPSPDFQNKTHNGDFADVLAEIDAYVGQFPPSRFVTPISGSHLNSATKSRPPTL